MEKRTLAVGLVFLVVAFLASSTVVHGQDQNAPDLKVASSDISFLPGGEVHDYTSVDIDANIHNDGICFIVLGENGDETGYTHTFSAEPLKVAARIRSSNGDYLTVRVHIGDYSLGVFETNNTSWEIAETPQAIPPTGHRC